MRGRLHYDFSVADHKAEFILRDKQNELLSLGDGGQRQHVAHDVVLLKQGSYVRDGRVVILDALRPEGKLRTVSADGKSQWIRLSPAMQVCASGRRRSLDEFPARGLNAKVLTNVRHEESLDSAAWWRAGRYKSYAQIAAVASVVQKMTPPN
jgi:hypothetical protein